MNFADAFLPFRVSPTTEEKAIERGLSAIRQMAAEEIAVETLERLSDVYSPIFVDAVEHVRAQLRAAEISNQPWPHMVIDDIFPAEFWRILVREIPPHSVFEDGKQKRDLDLTDTFGAFRLSPFLAQSSWRFAIDVLVRLVFLPELIDRWRQGLNKKYEDLFGLDCAHFRFATLNQRLMFRRRGYELKPHLDSSRLGLTCLTYLTGAEGEDAALGTDLYVGDALAVQVGHSTTYAHKHGVEVSPAGTVPFRPNRMLIFLNQSHAHHGASVPDDPKYENGRIIWQYHLAPFEAQFQAAAEQKSAA